MGGQRDAQSLLDVLRWRARHRPSSAAVGYRQAVLTFADLDRESAALAAALHRLGVQPGDRLALYLQSVPQVLIAQYAAWKLGAIVVPLNIMFKASELAYHLADAGAVGIVCLEEDVPRVLPVAEGAGLKFVISTGADDYSGESSGSAAAPGPRGDSPLSWRELLAAHRGDPPPFHRPGAGDVAYLHYTSGTTGSPKGAMITHGNIMFNARTYVKLGAIASHDKILAAAPLFHITGTIGHLALGCVAGIPIVLLYRFTPSGPWKPSRRGRPPSPLRPSRPTSPCWTTCPAAAGGGWRRSGKPLAAARPSTRPWWSAGSSTLGGTSTTCGA